MSKHTVAQVEDMIATENDAVVRSMLCEYADLLAENATLRDALSRLVEVHDAMGGVCGTARIAAEEALKEEGK